MLQESPSLTTVMNAVSPSTFGSLDASHASFATTCNRERDASYAESCFHPGRDMYDLALPVGAQQCLRRRIEHER
jgi:hypothetical protein